jgi:hypothetical protein
MLNNSIKDKNLILNLLKEGNIKAKFSLGMFSSNLTESLITHDYIGEITHIDMNTGYVNWKNEQGREMPCVSINTISLI